MLRKIFKKLKNIQIAPADIAIIISLISLLISINDILNKF